MLRNQLWSETISSESIKYFSCPVTYKWIKATKESRDESHEQKRVHETTEDMKMFLKTKTDPVEKELAQHKQKCLHCYQQGKDRHPEQLLEVDLSLAQEDLDGH
jgi:hypothetical protein